MYIDYHRFLKSYIPGLDIYEQLLRHERMLIDYHIRLPNSVFLSLRDKKRLQKIVTLMQLQPSLHICEYLERKHNLVWALN